MHSYNFRPIYSFPGILGYMLGLDDLTRKLTHLARDPLGVTVRRIRALGHSVDSERWAKVRLAQYGALSMLGDFVAKRPKDAIGPVYTHLWYLYKTVRKRKPRVALEFGSGCSTLVIAKALSDNKEGFLYSVDSSSQWAESTFNCIPSPLRSFFEISYSPISVETEDSGLCLLKHERIPDVIPNFVFLDGPPLAQGEVAVDLLQMVDRLPQDFMLVIDKRWENTAFLKKHLKGNYAIRQNHLTVFTL
jgi:hypothetical protein